MRNKVTIDCMNNQSAKELYQIYSAMDGATVTLVNTYVYIFTDKDVKVKFTDKVSSTSIMGANIYIKGDSYKEAISLYNKDDDFFTTICRKGRNIITYVSDRIKTSCFMLLDGYNIHPEIILYNKDDIVVNNKEKEDVYNVQKSSIFC